MWKPVFICLFAALFCVSAPAQKPNARDILKKVASVYATCHSYSDEGSVEFGLGGSSSVEMRFRTAFVQPASFRFELSHTAAILRDQGSYIAWKDGESTKSWFPFFGGGENELPFDTALARMASFSAGSSLLIPQLLLPRFFRTADLIELTADPKVAKEEKVGDYRAWRIEGTISGQKIIFWVDQNKYAIVKVYREVMVGSHSQKSTAKYKPRFNVDIPPENLAFLPPLPVVTTLPPERSPLPSLAALPAPPKLREFGSTLSRSVKVPIVRAGNPETSTEDVIRVDTDLVTSAVLVVNPQGGIVTGLTQDDFIVKEDNKLQEVKSFSLGDSKDVPRSIVLIIDYSASQLPYLRTSIDAAKTLVDKLNPKDRMAVVTDDVQLLVDFTSDKQLLKDQLESLRARAIGGKPGASEQYDALMATFNELLSNEDIRPIIIFQTDGDQLEALKGFVTSSPYIPPRRYGLEDFFTAAERTRATVYSIIPGVQFAGAPLEDIPRRARLDWSNRRAATIELLKVKKLPIQQSMSITPDDEFFVHYPDGWLRRQAALVEIAKHAGAWAEFLERPDQADEIYTRILTDIDRRYVLGYYPSNRTRDGKRRKVSVEVRGHPEYLVWGQKTYFARQEP